MWPSVFRRQQRPSALFVGHVVPIHVNIVVQVESANGADANPGGPEWGEGGVLEASVVEHSEVIEEVVATPTVKDLVSGAILDGWHGDVGDNPFDQVAAFTPCSEVPNGRHLVVATAVGEVVFLSAVNLEVGEYPVVGLVYCVGPVGFGVAPVDEDADVEGRIVDGRV